LAERRCKLGYKTHMNGMRFAGVSLLALAASGFVACNKTPGAGEATPSASSAAAPTAAGLGASASAAPSGAPLGGLDPCLVGNWKSQAFSLRNSQATAEGGANVAMNVAASGETSLDFGPMTKINAKGAGANFDFQYSGKATATLSTPARGTITADKADYARLRVTASVQIPGAGKMDVFENKPVSELAQLATAVASTKPTAGAPPPGLDANPIFSTTRYTCKDGKLTLDSDQLAAQWTFVRTGS
jgi:hypothetical protein